MGAIACDMRDTAESSSPNILQAVEGIFEVKWDTVQNILNFFSFVPFAFLIKSELSRLRRQKRSSPSVQSCPQSFGRKLRRR